MPSFCGYPDGPCSLSDGEHARHPSSDGYKFPKARKRSDVKTQLPVNRVSPPARPKRMTLATVTSGVAKDPNRIFIYGDGGLGKTTFAAEYPGTIFLDTQDGSKRIKGTKRFRRPDTWEDVLEAIDELLEGTHEYKYLAIDLIDDIERMIWTYICKRDHTPQKPRLNIEDYGFNKGPTIALPEWRMLIAKIERLRHERGMGVVFVGHSGVCKFKNPEGEDYGMFGPQIDAKASGLVRGWCDTVLFAREETYVKTNSETRRSRGISTGVRVIHTTGTAAFFAKNRDNLPTVLPLDRAEFEAAVERGQPADPEVVREEISKLLVGCDDALSNAVAAEVEKSGEDSGRLARVLNKLRERVQTHDQQPGVSETSQENEQ